MSNSLAEQQKQLIKALISNADEKVVSMLLDLKNEGDLFYLETLLDILTGQRSEMLKMAILDYVSDIKHKGAVQIIANYLDVNSASKDVIKIVTASWQSRLDFSNNLDPFISILINGNYKIAFESFTVIENSLDSLPKDIIANHMAAVKKGIVNSNRDKQLLLLEMVSVLDKAKRATV